jgi:hypothetical protein
VVAAAGDLTAARDHCQASLEIRVKLAAAGPARTKWQRDLSVVQLDVVEWCGTGAGRYQCWVWEAGQEAGISRTACSLKAGCGCR